jgi:hypothetical protein
MPIWSDAPDNPSDVAIFRIVRTPATGVYTAIVTGLEAVGCNTHYANNRTVPCEGPRQCNLCHEGFSYRWHGYLTALTLPSLEHVVFEFTATAADTFANYRRLHGTLRACRFRASRPSKRPNGRVLIETSPGDPQKTRLPDPPNLRKILCHIWNVQYTENQPTDMTRPPFQRVNVDDNGKDGRIRTSLPRPKL